MFFSMKIYVHNFVPSAAYLPALGTISDEVSDCNVDQSVKTYDLANRRLSMQFDMDVFYSNPNCSRAVNTHTLGYDYATDGNTFTFSIDVHTLFAALSVAYKVNGPDSLKLFQQIDTVVSAAWFMGKQYDVQRWYDPMNPQMEPMFCIGETGVDVDTYNCVVAAGGRLLATYPGLSLLYFRSMRAYYCFRPNPYASMGLFIMMDMLGPVLPASEC